jgi:hypothetical protein
MNQFLRKAFFAATASGFVSLVFCVLDPNPHDGLGLLAASVLWWVGLVSLAVMFLDGIGAKARVKGGRRWWQGLAVPIGILVGTGLGVWGAELLLGRS